MSAEMDACMAEADAHLMVLRHSIGALTLVD
jgi:hypothetical protein